MTRMSSRHRALLATSIAAMAAVALTGCKAAPAPKTATPKSQTESSTPESPAPTKTQQTQPPSFPEDHRKDVKASPDDQFTLFRKRVDPGGTSHERFTRTFHGLPVYGGDVVLHFDKSGALTGTSNSLPGPMAVNIAPNVPVTAATTSAKAAFTGTIERTGVPRLIVDASRGTGTLAWETEVIGKAADGHTPSHLHVLTDARSGKTIGAWDEIETATGTGKTHYSGTVKLETSGFPGYYRLSDPSHGNNSVCSLQNKDDGFCKEYSDKDNVWDEDPVAVDALYGAGVTFDYFKTAFARNGVFDDGRGVPSRVHQGDKLANSFWDGKEMTYGDGNGNVQPWTELDVVGHEMSHGITENSVSGGLTYAGESGGLNEATSDIFGEMVEFYANNPNDPPDYMFGEKINDNNNGTPVRYLYNPPLDGVSEGCWSAATKAVDPHYSSGIANHFFFDLAEGTGRTQYGTSPSCTGTTVKGVGRDKASKIWYRALDVYFTSSTSYVDTANPGNTARAYTLQAAADLYGNCGAEYKAVQRAWTAVNVAGKDATCK
jgi:Zn-dependent metalloprotease